MTFDYAEIATTSAELLAEFGQEVTLRNVTPGVYNPATSSTSAPTETDVKYKGALFDFGAGQTMERGTLIQAGDKKLLLDPAAVVDPQDRVLDAAGVVYSIISIGEIKPAGTRVLYNLHLRT